MTTKLLFQSSTGRMFRMGRIAPIARQPRLSFRNYLLRSLSPAPPRVDYSQAAMPCLRNILGNDRYGNCVIAGYYHVKGLWTGNAGKLWTPTLAQVVTDYHAIGGPGDNGCDEQQALNYWTQRGDQGGTKLTGWLSVNANDPEEIRQAIYLFLHVYYGTAMPDHWVNPMPQGDGFVWDVAGRADPSNGHCYLSGGYDEKGPDCWTWGMKGTVTYAAIAAYNIQRSGGELYVMLSRDIINQATQKCPAGVDWSQLIADFDSLGGNIPIPPPVNPPPPIPTPPTPPVPVVTPPSWVQLIEWLIQFLSSKEAPDMTSWFSVFLHLMMGLLVQFGPKALPWIESLVNSSSLSAAQKAIVIAILEQIFPVNPPIAAESIRLSGGMMQESPTDTIARLKSEWGV